MEAAFCAMLLLLPWLLRLPRPVSVADVADLAVVADADHQIKILR